MRDKVDSLFLNNPLISHNVDKLSIDSERLETSKLSQMVSDTLGEVDVSWRAPHMLIWMKIKKIKRHEKLIKNLEDFRG